LILTNLVDFDEAIGDESTMNAFTTWLLGEEDRSTEAALLPLIKDIQACIMHIRSRGGVSGELKSLWDKHWSSSVTTGASLLKMLSTVETAISKLAHFAAFDGPEDAAVRQETIASLESVESEAKLIMSDAYGDFLDEANVIQTGRPRSGILCWAWSARRRTYLYDLIAFFICGLINNFGYVVMLSAADHIGGKLPESATLLADILPTFIIKISAPFFMDRIPYKARITFAIFMGLVSFQLVAWGPSSTVKLLGVVCASISSGLGEITFLALSAFYHRNVISAWSSGTGAAGIVGATWYLAFTAWFTFIKAENRPFVAMIACSGMPLFMAFAYFILMSPTKFPSSRKNLPGQISDAGRSRRAINSSMDQGVDDVSLTEQPAEIDEDIIEGLDLDNILVESGLDSSLEARPLTLSERLKMIPTLLWYILPLLLVYFGEYLINQGVDPSLVWPGTAISCQEYRYYQFLYQGGVFLSRSSVNFFRIRNIWWLPLLQILNLNVLTLQAIYHFIPYYWIVFLIVIFEGLLGGATYVNVYYALSTETTGIVREYSMSMTSVSDSIGISLAAAVGLGLGPFLKLLNRDRIAAGNCVHA
jgi:battenin